MRRTGPRRTRADRRGRPSGAGARLLLAAALLGWPRRAAGQGATADPAVVRGGGTGGDTLPHAAGAAPSCDGRIVSAVEIDARRPPFTGSSRFWHAMAHGVGLHHATTRPHVIRGLLRLRADAPCSDVALRESERILRAEPFLASAAVTAVPDTGGRVRVLVRTVDEVPALVTGRFRGLRPHALLVGNENLGGEGIRTELYGARLHGYRDQLGVHVLDYAAFDGPYTLDLGAERHTPGGALWTAALAHPFLTDLQRTAWQGGYAHDDAYYDVVRPAGDLAALRVRQARWEASTLVRRPVLGLSGVFGIALTGLSSVPQSSAVLVGPHGLLPDTGTMLAGRYPALRVVRPSLLAGVRDVRYVAAEGVRTLRAREDLPTGVEFGLQVGQGLSGLGVRDLFLASTGYVGHASPTGMLGVEVAAEGRQDPEEGEWNGLIVSGRLAALRRISARHTLELSDEAAGSARARLPLQLTMGGTSGLPGYQRSRLAGGWRNVARLEDRVGRAAPLGNASLALAPFVAAGTLLAGDAPYGRTVPLRTSVGLGLLASIPSSAKRVLRMDVAVPTSRRDRARWELRFGSSDPTRAFWSEPGPVRAARIGPVPSRLFGWQVR